MKPRRSVLPTIILIMVIGLIYTLSNSKSLDGPTAIQKVPIQINEGLQETILDSHNEITIDDNEEEVPEQKPVKEVNAGNTGTVDQEPFTGETEVKSPQELASGNTEIAFMPKMTNETLKAELGNAAWRLFHTILARYPEHPSQTEQSTLGQYIQLFAQVYPCGDCARHFQQLLAKYPPQTGSRKTAALWGCHVHNKVNERLEKPEYDCTKILEDYDCGCGDDEKEIDVTLGGQAMNNLKNVEVQEESEQLG